MISYVNEASDSTDKSYWEVIYINILEDKSRIETRSRIFPTAMPRQKRIF